MALKVFNESQILYEDRHLIILNKFCSQIVQGDRTGDLSLLDLLREYIRIRDKKPGNAFLGLVHRLDRPCSGIVIFAKTSKALTRMNEEFRQKRVDKRYWAIVEQLPPRMNAELCHYLKKNSKLNKSFAYDRKISNSRESRLEYSVLHRLNTACLLEIRLYTGRHHQIRAQLASIGVHIRGDVKYGAKRSVHSGGICLHARFCQFTHPISMEKIDIIASPLEVQFDSLWSQVPISHFSSRSSE